MAFVDAYKALVLALMAYVKAWHATGVAWNNTAVSLVDGWMDGWMETPSVTLCLELIGCGLSLSLALVPKPTINIH